MKFVEEINCKYDYHSNRFLANLTINRRLRIYKTADIQTLNFINFNNEKEVENLKKQIGRSKINFERIRKIHISDEEINVSKNGIGFEITNHNKKAYIFYEYK